MKAESLLLVIKNLLFTLVVPASVAFYVPPLFTARPLVWTGAAHQWLALPFFAAGVAIYLWCLWDFASFGRATPLPLDPPKRLVVRGLYRHVRNPMYVGVLLAILGQALFFPAREILYYGLGTLLSVHCMVVFYEEPVLTRRFGADYLAYRARVRRWWPRWKP